MATYLVQMPDKAYRRQYPGLLAGRIRNKSGRAGFTLAESMVVIVIVSLFAMLAVGNLGGLLTRNTFKAQANEFVSTMQMAVRAAAESDRRYEVIIDLAEQSYLLRQITTSELYSDVLEEEIIVENEFGDNCEVVSILFDDLEEAGQDDQRARFVAGHIGWQYGGVIYLLDQNEKMYSVVVNRMNRIVELKAGEAVLLEPKAKEDVTF